MEHSIEVVSPVARKISVTVPAAGVTPFSIPPCAVSGANCPLTVSARQGARPRHRAPFPRGNRVRATETLVNGQVSEILEKEGLNPISRIEFDSGDARQVERIRAFPLLFPLKCCPIPSNCPKT